LFAGGCTIKNIFGNTVGLKPSQIRKIEKLYRRRIPADEVLNRDLARYLTELSFEIGRQIGLLADRKGIIRFVVVGDPKGLFLPDLSRYRTSSSRLCGLRLIHTHLKETPLSSDDLTDLALLRLDLIAAVSVGTQGLPGRVFLAHLMPHHKDGDPWKILPPQPLEGIKIDFLPYVLELENRINRSLPEGASLKRSDRAILIGVTTRKRVREEEALLELEELAHTAGIEVLDRILQRRPRIHPRFVMGEGKLKELVITALQRGADLIVFNQDLTAGQARSIARLTEMRIIDRTQLILDIFAQHAMSREGKVQVELAQLRYLLPRLGEKDSGLSRLTGGIGGRGPGETKLEISRRRTRDRINRLERTLKQINLGRKQRRARRNRQEIPIISIVGYTNAGKSTLLNALTRSTVLTEDKLFATLDTATRRLRFPREREVIITDTVGFIRDLPEDLFGAFSATLDELQDANLLLHVVDLSSPSFEDHMETVEKVLADLDLLSLPSLLIFNKIDRLPTKQADRLAERFKAIPVSAKQKKGLRRITRAIEEILWEQKEESA